MVLKGHLWMQMTAAFDSGKSWHLVVVDVIAGLTLSDLKGISCLK